MVRRREKMEERLQEKETEGKEEKSGMRGDLILVEVEWQEKR